jgi:hypothetical protein
MIFKDNDADISLLSIVAERGGGGNRFDRKQ